MDDDDDDDDDDVVVVVVVVVVVDDGDDGDGDGDGDDDGDGAAADDDDDYYYYYYYYIMINILIGPMFLYRPRCFVQSFSPPFCTIFHPRNGLTIFCVAQLTAGTYFAFKMLATLDTKFRLVVKLCIFL